MTFLEQLFQIAKKYPDRVAVEQLARKLSVSASTLSYRELVESAARLAARLRATVRCGGGPAKIGLVAENGPNWVIADIALQLLGWIEVPLALEFSPAQASHLLAGTDAILCDTAGAEVMARWHEAGDIAAPVLDLDDLVTGRTLIDTDEFWAWAIHGLSLRPDRVIKIIHTSGTTAKPKGVRIRAEALEIQMQALRRDLDTQISKRYLCFVPLSLLDDQIFAIFLTLSGGGTAIFLPSGCKPFVGAGTAASDYLAFFRQARPTLTLVPPAIVESLEQEVAWFRSVDAHVLAMHRVLFDSDKAPVIACGGAPVSIAVLSSLEAAGIIVYEGYGLSEAASIVTWNRPGAYRLGTVGQPAPHVELRVAEDGELLVRTPTLFAGYDGQDATSLLVTADGWLHTGDTVEIEDDGYVRILGRKKNVIIISTGRNVSPEWVEAVYRKHPIIDNIVVFGDSRAGLVAAVVPRDGHHDNDELTRALRSAASDTLAEYDRVQRYVVLERDKRSAYFTVTGRPRRKQLWASVENAFSIDEDMSIGVY